MDKQQLDLRLRHRADAAALLTRVLDGHRDRLPTDAAAISRWCTGTCMSPLGWVLVMVAVLPEARAAMLLSAVGDAYDEVHGAPVDTTLTDALLAADLSDSAEDNARARVAIRGASEEDLQSLIRTTYAQDHDSGLLRRLARRELHGRRGYRPPHRRPKRSSPGREARAS